MAVPDAPSGDRYPRQRARTRGFRLGQPRGFALSPDGRRIAFLRERSGTDPVGCLWVADVDARAAALEERLVVDPRVHIGDVDADELPAAERARRERLREGGSGIAAFGTDAEGTLATFALGGEAFVVDLVDPAAAPRAIPGSAGAVDPRLAPDGRHVGFVAEGALRVVGLDPEGVAVGPPSTLAAPGSPTVTWGLADFIAAEEFTRHRGWWWLADGSGILAARVDEEPVDTWWIGDPANPAQPPRLQRYPAAGRPNAEVSLWLIDLAGRHHEIPWDRERFPYVTSVHVGSGGGSDPVVSVLSRDQRDQLILRVDPAVATTVTATGTATGTATVTAIAERHDDAWVDVIPGVPRLDDRGRLLEVVRDPSSDSNRLTIDGDAVSPAGFQVRGVVDVGPDGILLHGSEDPTQDIPVLLHDAGWQPLADPGIAGARRSGDAMVLSTSVPATSTAPPGTTTTVWHRRGPESAQPSSSGSSSSGSASSGWMPIGALASWAETPLTHPRVDIARLGASRLPTAVLWPTGHVPGSRRLPVLLAPYGGPHARRVVDSRLAYATDQWWADRGFCVVIADGRGTPGRGPAWERAIRGDLAGVVLEDQIAALDAVLESYPGDTDPDRVGIHGWSFGGYLAALAVLRRPDRVHAAVAGAPVTDWRLYDTAYTERYLGDPAVAGASYDACSLLEGAAALRRPLLLIHGLADDNVVAAHTLRLSAALLAAGRPHSVLPLSGVTHMTPQEVVAENLLLAQADFLASHLGAEPA